MTSRDLQIIHAAGQIGEEKVGLMLLRKGVICGQQCGTKDKRNFPSTSHIHIVATTGIPTFKV